MDIRRPARRENKLAHIIIVNGPARSGKDTFCSLCRDRAYFYDMLIAQISSVDIIKEVARRLGWNGEKDDKSRKFLSDLKDLSTQYSDAPLEYLTKEFNRVKDHDNVMLFMHIREPEEIQRAKERFDALTLLIKRPSQSRAITPTVMLISMITIIRLSTTARCRIWNSRPAILLKK